MTQCTPSMKGCMISPYLNYNTCFNTLEKIETPFAPKLMNLLEFFKRYSKSPPICNTFAKLSLLSNCVQYPHLILVPLLTIWGCVSNLQPHQHNVNVQLKIDGGQSSHQWWSNTLDNMHWNMCFNKHKLIYALSHGPCTWSNVPMMTRVVKHLDKIKHIL
jgi:hypothetical protein